MNVMESFNKTLEYIETVLDGEMDERKISFLSGYSFPVFRRMFSVLTGQTLAEYMRYRKLTQAAVDLREMDLRVIDIALKYGYESADSFGMAFKNYHGHTPFEVRNGKAFKVLSKIQLALSIQGGRNTNVVIQKKGKVLCGGSQCQRYRNNFLSGCVGRTLHQIFSRRTLCAWKRTKFRDLSRCEEHQ